jgi:iron complex transport system permease protein
MRMSSAMRLPRRRFLVVLALLLPAALLLYLGVGSVSLSWQALARAVGAAWSGEGGRDALILFAIRLPRALVAISAGMILASCGAVLQGLFRNPLADPSLIGVSSGASVGASLAIVFASLWGGAGESFGLSAVTAGAFAGGLLTTLLVYRLATSGIGTSVTTMLLAGIAITAVAGALNSLLGYFADNDMLRQISLWQMGALGNANWPRALLVCAVALLLAALLPRESRALDALLLGESEARYLGIDVERLKRRLIVLTALGVGVCVAMAGLLAFIGLVVPHAVRLLLGPDHRGVIPGAALGGALLLLLADNLARVVAAPAELPAGIITALLGAPVFLALLLQQRRSL